MSKQNRGRLIVIEGLDRSGKSTQCQLLVDKLISQHEKAELFKFPDRTTAIGKKIDDYLKESVQLNDQVIHLLFSANRWETIQYIYEQINKGVTCILDRYAFSGIAFSAAKGLDWEWCKSPDRGLPRPDLVIFLNVDPRIAATRGQYGEERYEKIEMQEKVLKNFQRLQKEFREEGLEFITLDASSSLEDVHSQIVDLVSNVNIHETLDVL
ncbi:Thymidylate kinase [Schizosaccharomyces pombe]|uniref:Thymidylate kinase n=1 Tax=Schizosaccharomyces pombe (strain 972 / ATCC 24843) TaxID=284812 RepID=KTHY_SCHPO|nr:thymidylate kinase Tmp1 [Schizosaccharomyces pombe]P36590.2 RecName: Full=Thymidylate kinase; AltName: Full=dTMP kinase [Schizosaccharomyces pombe 972h-]CAA19357.1 thymidylate kinase Tmp1 [Schizosaccharomyces pombe]|eukprot:NP_001342734.1 thymidylate kinase Tmp1 [Schizosaccharomyces pombe]